MAFSIVRSALLLVAVVLPVSAADRPPQGDEFALLQQQVRDLQLRVERLEKAVDQGVPVNMARKVEAFPGGWREARNWKLLAGGMTNYRVKEILGEPARQKTVKKFEFWYYGDGKVSLYMRRLKSWEVPSDIASE